MASMSDAQRIHHSWLRAVAASTGGKAFGTHKTDWIWLPTRKLVVGMFPQTISEAGIRPALAEADRLGATDVELWLNASTRINGLLDLGFSQGRQPWWMPLKLAD